MSNKLKMTFDPRTIEHLGIKMYSTLPPAIAELIANAYDACASEAIVKLSDNPKKIEVIDNGTGMTFNEVNEYFLKIGRNRRIESQETPCERFPTGKKGLGKLALFGIGKKIEVINAGIPGYTTYQEMEFLKAYGLDMEPDMVILGFVFNDLFYKYLHKPTEKELLSHEPQAELNRFDTNSIVGSVFAKSYLAHSVAYIIERIQNKLARRPYLSFEHRRDFYLAWKPYGWRHSERLIAQMKQLLDKKNIQFNIITFPVSSQVDKTVLSFDEKYVLYPQSRIKEIAAKNNIPFYDLTNSIQNNGDLKLYKDYLHFNSNGNDIIAKELTQYLLTKNYSNPDVSPRSSRKK